MKKCVMGIDLGTSSVKVTCINKSGEVVAQNQSDFKVLHPEKGYCEQDPNEWYRATVTCIRNIVSSLNDLYQIVGCSFSGQMHSLVLIDKLGNVIRPAILWNDTRTSVETNFLNSNYKKKLVEITGNKATEGFTLTKLLWVKKHEPETFKRIYKFMMPKDYLRYRMTGKINTDYSDATGTILLNIKTGCWSKEICTKFGIPLNICPSLVSSTDLIGYPTDQVIKDSGISKSTRIFAGCADNAAGALGTGLIDTDKVMCSIGTSGVILAKEENNQLSYNGLLQMESHAISESYYSMGVTLSAGNSLNWLKNTFFKDMNYSEMMKKASKSVIGANGLLFTPYLDGERTPYTDSKIRGSFIGITNKTTDIDFIRSVVEGITFSLNDVFQIYLNSNKSFKQVISTGGGAKSRLWLQIQADIFNIPVVSITNEQGPGTGAAMIASMGCQWFNSWKDCVKQFVHYGETIMPIETNVNKYRKLYAIYHKMYSSTTEICTYLNKVNK